MPKIKNQLSLSVIVCTYNRANFLKMALESLTSQTLDQKEFEVIVIDDGSKDNTKEVVGSFQASLPIKYFFQKNSGLASAKNHGIYAAQGNIIMFFDDDDIAEPIFLEQHMKSHRAYPEENFSVLNYTSWSPNINTTSLMHFITEVGCYLFSYPYIKDGDILDYTNFWGGRTSCKRSFLLEHGVFNPVFRFGCEDIELGYRLSKQNLKVVYNSKAESRMVREVSFDDFCKRLVQQGRSQYIFSSLHNDFEVYQYAEIMEAEKKWNEIKHAFDAKVKSTKALDLFVNLKKQNGFPFDDLDKRLLYDAYHWVFKACKIKGIFEASQGKVYVNGAYSLNGNDSNKELLISIMQSNGLSENNHTEKKDKHIQFEANKISSFENYQEYALKMQVNYFRRQEYERSLIIDTNPFKAQGHCYVCKKEVEFSVDYSYSYKKNGIDVPNFREHLICPVCGLNNRMRAAIHLFEQEIKKDSSPSIYLTEQVTPLYNWFLYNYSNVVGSEYIENSNIFDVEQNSELRYENLTELSFANNEFDCVLSFEVFEHIPDYMKAFKECYRVLRPGGTLFFSVPFEINSESNKVLAAVTESNAIKHYFTPEHHGDPLNSEGCLAFYRFGWKMLKQLYEVGFTNVCAYLYWSKYYGYLGDDQIMFAAQRS